MQRDGNITFSGDVAVRHFKGKAPRSWQFRNKMRRAYMSGVAGLALAKSFSRFTGTAVFQGELSIVKIYANGHREDYGVVSRHLVTVAFVNYMVDNLVAETSAWGDFKYHDSGVGTTPAANTDTDIETTDGESRASGTQLEGASANIYKSVGTISYTSTKAITEHGLFSSAASTTLMDRHVFAALNVVSGDSLEFTYQLTCTAES